MNSVGTSWNELLARHEYLFSSSQAFRRIDAPFRATLRQLYISTLISAELYTWAHQRSDPRALAERTEREFLADVGVLDFDSDCARKFGAVRGTLLVRNIAVNAA